MKNPGFTAEERCDMTKMLETGFIDTFRNLHPDKIQYSWWAYRFNARARNVGWRIDYFLVADKLKSKIKSASIHDQVLGSDHCPVELVISDL
jgi:exodeoxyribonuclease-3